jgi:hypothetical protein
MGAETIAPTEILLPEASMTINDFCLVERISRATFFKMQKAGYAPETLRVPGLATVRITAKARREWQQRLAALKDDIQIEKKREETVNIARRAGKLGGAPKHRRTTRARRS